MELEWLILVVIVFVSLYYLFRLLNFNLIPRVNKSEQLGFQLPPGSTGWPIIGETLEYLSTAKQGVPEKFIADRRNKHSSSVPCKVFKTSLLQESMAVLCTAAGNKFLFSNENKLVKSWWPANFEKIFANSEKTDTTQESIRLRKVLSPFLKPDALHRYIGAMDEVTKQHLNMYWSCSSSVDYVKEEDESVIIKVHPLAKKYTFTLACKLFLNIEDPKLVAKLEELIRHISSGFISLPINFPGTKFNRAIRASKQIKKEIEEMVKQRRIDLHPHLSDTSNSNHHHHYHDQDLLSRLLVETYSDGKELMTESDIANKLYGLIVGAYDNISTTLVSIIMFLSKLPHVYDAVLKEQMEIAESKAEGELLNWEELQKMKYSWSVACEALRLLPPILGTFREAITDFSYEGYIIPKGMKLHWNTYATHKNPEYFPEPEKFDPSRFQRQGPAPYSYVPFGGGPRMCPGKEYARFKILVFMHNVVTRFKWEMVFPDEKMIMDPVLVPTKGLTIRLFPHPSLSP
ncbi:PREDICTED: beta-amyrin 28-oxidase-like [Fragaria vesca subsp. vesca]|uniref:beta-amyrin 28-oxidase-like n=1 Tax=Fragaria vesca subsp. vesca TaxID=101020 RepID=UPI0002C2E3AD|nr:PREDICTED: beta-amyrin 28-oxidase-like [Fragaria vesca subsp. vesca]